MNKKRMAKLMQLADSVLEKSGIINGNFIEDSYNGQTAGFGVTVAMNGLLPALVIYYQQASETREINRKNILEAIARMIALDDEYKDTFGIRNADTLLRAAIDSPTNKTLKREVLDCAVALKQIIRTYKLK